MDAEKTRFPIGGFLAWSGIWFVRVILIVSIGSLLGTIAFLLFDVITGYPESTAYMLTRGLFDGGFYALIWAPGISFVWCVMECHSRNSRKN